MSKVVATVYLESSQHKRWTLTKEELINRRKQVNESAIATIKANNIEEQRLSGKSAVKSPEFPSFEEELLIVDYYAAKVFDTGTVFGLPSHLKATAAAYLRRFYISKSPLQYHPKNIMITSLFLATKTCEYHVDLDTFVAKLPKQSRESVLEHEFLISSTILFDFLHWSAYRPLYGFILDMEGVVDTEEEDQASRKARLTQTSKLYESAKALVNACIWSDLPFLYSPSHIALAALYASDATVSRDYLARKGMSEMIAVLEDIGQKMSEVAAVRFETPEMMAKVKAADKKLYYAKDPALTKGSALFKHRAEEGEREETAKRRKKGDEARESQKAFGDVLA